MWFISLMSKRRFRSFQIYPYRINYPMDWSLFCCSPPKHACKFRSSLCCRAPMPLGCVWCLPRFPWGVWQNCGAACEACSKGCSWCLSRPCGRFFVCSSQSTARLSDLQIANTRVYGSCNICATGLEGECSVPYADPFCPLNLSWNYTRQHCNCLPPADVSLRPRADRVLDDSHFFWVMPLIKSLSSYSCMDFPWKSESK